MYIQVTDRCNMRCEHCCMESSPHRKNFMSMAMFEMCLDVAIDFGDTVTIGGGEPTLHPEIFTMLNKVMRAYAWGELEGQPFMVTNGKNKARAKKIYALTQPDEDFGMYPVYAYDGTVAEYKEEPLLRVELSTDYYHEAIDSEILEMYRRSERRRDPGAGVRDVTRSLAGVMGIGRALKNGISDFDKGECACETIFIGADGDVYSCGCKGKKLGEVWDLREIMSDFDYDNCHVARRKR